MLKAGIVGLKNSTKYINALENLSNCLFVGLYDPSFQVELKLFNEIDQGVLNFDDLLSQCDIIIFSADDKVFYPLVKKAISSSKAVFLDSVYKYNYYQINQLNNLAHEAGVQLLVAQPSLYDDVVCAFLDKGKQALMLDCSREVSTSRQILRAVREEIAFSLFIIKSNVRNVKVNVISSCNEIPDIYNIAIDFNNGCFCKILVSAIHLPNKKNMRIVGANANFDLDFTNSICTYYLKGKKTQRTYNSQLNSPEKLVTKQLADFFLHVLNTTTPKYSVDFEANATLVFEKVTDKLKVCMNIV